MEAALSILVVLLAACLALGAVFLLMLQRCVSRLGPIIIQLREESISDIDHRHINVRHACVRTDCACAMWLAAQINLWLA